MPTMRHVEYQGDSTLGIPKHSISFPEPLHADDGFGFDIYLGAAALFNQNHFLVKRYQSWTPEIDESEFGVH